MVLYICGLSKGRTVSVSLTILAVAMQDEARFWPYTYFDCDFNQVQLRVTDSAAALRIPRLICTISPIELLLDLSLF